MSRYNLKSMVVLPLFFVLYKKKNCSSGIFSADVKFMSLKATILKCATQAFRTLAHSMCNHDIDQVPQHFHYNRRKPHTHCAG